MKLKPDESLTHRLQQPLQELGHDVSTAAEEELLGKSDAEVAAAAAHERRILLSLDLGFADIRDYPPGSHPGIVVFRPVSRGFHTVIRLVRDFVSRSDLNVLGGCVVVVDPGRMRVRWPELGDREGGA
jgi:predicted nuclease of predicted toxin-antitoxin system